MIRRIVHQASRTLSRFPAIFILRLLLLGGPALALPVGGCDGVLVGEAPRDGDGDRAGLIVERGLLGDTRRGLRDGGPVDPGCSAADRDPAGWPFEVGDPWNTPIGSGATLATVDSPAFNPKAGAFLNCTTWSHPVYVATSSDPVRSFHRQDGSLCAEVRVPHGSAPDPEADAHLHVIDEKHARVVETWGCRLEGDDSYSAAACVVNDLRGPGVYSSWHGTRAYGGSAIGGLIRKGELARGIPHALAVSVESAALNRNGPGGKHYVWPASSADNGAASSYGDSGNLFMGSLLTIAPDVVLASLGLSAAGLEVGRAMQDYGIYITDIGGSNMAYYAEPGAASEIPAALGKDLNKLTALLQVVTNNSAASRGGGGKPRRCPAPPFIP